MRGKHYINITFHFPYFHNMSVLCANITVDMDKTKCMLFRKKREYFKYVLSIYYMDLILRVGLSCITFLGVTIYDNFTWIQHIENTCINMSKSIYILNKVRYVIDRKVLYSIIYCTLVLPYIHDVCL